MIYQGRSPKTLEQFILDSKKIHGQKYSYEMVIYINAHTKVELFCKKHQKYFKITPSNHLHRIQKQGCPLCGKILNFKKRFEETKNSLIFDFRKTHGNKYDYSEFVYKGDQVKGKIFCKFHKEYFWQTPNNHKRIDGCPKCGDIVMRQKQSARARAEFKKKARGIHKNKYSYTDFIYVNNRTKGPIFCKRHKIVFYQDPSNHLAGKGCPECRLEKIRWHHSKNLTKEERGQPGYFYYMSFKISGKTFYKIGVSKRNISAGRLRELRKEIGLPVKLIFAYPSTRFKVHRLEEKVLKEFKDFKALPPIKFGGHTECFGMDILGLATHH
jgi:Meiotically up-regulated gene 113